MPLTDGPSGGDGLTLPEHLPDGCTIIPDGETITGMTLPTPAPNLGLMLSRFTPYVLGHWWASRGYGNATPVITWTAGNNYSQELAVRAAAMNAFTLAVTEFTGCTNPGLGSSQPEGLGSARLILAVSRQHVSNSPTGMQSWGRSWQSPLWAAWAGLAAMCAWDFLPYAADRDKVLTMLEDEADYVLYDRPPLFWKDASGTELRPGDSAAEENSWCATVLWVAAALMPMHDHADDWASQAVELGTTAFLTPADGDPRGSNVRDDFLIVNHGRIHPDYMTSVGQNLFGPVAFGLTGRTAPLVAYGRIADIYDAFQTAPMDSAGTVAYNPATPNVSFPIGTPNDWGNRRPAAYVNLDGLVALYSLWRPGLPVGPWYWHRVHLADLSSMQNRPASATHPAGAFNDTAASPVESTYPEENAYSGSQLAFYHLARYLAR